MKKILVYILAVPTVLVSFSLGEKINLSDYSAQVYIDSVSTQAQFSQPLSGTLGDYYVDNVFLHSQVLRIISKMSVEQKVGQLLMPAWESNNSVEDMINDIRKYQLGGMMVLNNEAQAEETQVIKAELDQVIGGVPGLFSIDAEPSLLRYRIPQASYSTTTTSLDSIEASYNSGLEIAEILQPFAYNYNFAPVYDSGVNTSIIGNRSYPGDGARVVSLAQAFNDAMNESSIITTGKHFPGHGSVLGDTHVGLQTVDGSLPELDTFSRAVEQGLLSVMVGHLAIGPGEYGTEGLPASISPEITQGLLREHLGFEGVVITDAMVMGALDSFENVDISAIESGVDIVLMPRDIEVTYSALVERIKSDRVFEQQVNEKLYRIIRLKLVQKWSHAN